MKKGSNDKTAKAFTKTLDRLVDYLAEEGFRPNLSRDEHDRFASVAVRYRLCNYLINVNGMSDYYEVGCSWERIPCSPLEELQAINKVNAHSKLAKICLYEDRELHDGDAFYVIKTSAHYRSVEDFIENFTTMIANCHDAYERFRHNLES